MSDTIDYFINQTPYTQRPVSRTQDYRRDVVSDALRFHQTMPGYAPTPLVTLAALAHRLGVGAVYVKDESQRFGLNAFKALGASYAMARYIAARLNTPLSELPFPVMAGAAVKQRLAPITFATTTDGNHGRGLAWMARQLGQRSVVYMPHGSSQQRLEAIRGEGAEAEIVAMNYDDAVRMTAARAAKRGWIIVQDTAWPGYEDLPLWIMQGYSTLMLEALDQLAPMLPTHVLVQAGVGSFAGMVQGTLTAAYGAQAPRVVVVESNQADCLFRSARSMQGQAIAVGGEMNTIMAGLACGEANGLSWPMLRDYAHAFISCPDAVAAHGMRLLGNPLAGDRAVVSGESGAVTAGLLSMLLRLPHLQPLRDALALDNTSRVLLISTEGDTDRQRYRDIVWDGAVPSFQPSFAI